MKKFKFFIFFLISNFVFSAEYNWEKAPGKENLIFKFVHITDTHCISNAKFKKEPKNIIQIGPYRAHWKDSYHSFLILEKTIEYINEKIKPSFLVHTGDISENGNFNDLKKSREILRKLNCPFYIIKGDHDGIKNKNFEKIFKKRCYSTSYNGWHFIFVSIYPDEEEIEWIKKDISKHSQKPTVFLTHRLIICDNLTSSLVKKFYGNIPLLMEKADFFRSFLKESKNVKLVISGHIHTNLHYKENGINFISTTALLEIPHQFRVFEFYKNMIKIKLLTAYHLKDVKEKNWKLQNVEIIKIEK